MIAVEKFGSNFMGALNYNLKKLNYPKEKMRAELLATSFSSLVPGMIKKEVDLIKALRPNLKKHVWHTSLNFSIEENPANLTNDRLLSIGLDYMRSMGYDDNQYLIVRHHDAEHPHIHLLVNRISYDGNVVSDSNNFRRSLTVLRRLEQQYNLISLDQYNDVPVVSKESYNNIATDRDSSITAELYNNRSPELPNSRSIDQGTAITANRYNAIALNQGNSITNEHHTYRTGNQANRVTKRALTKNEIEKTLRTGVPSDKSLLQAILEPMIYDKQLTLQDFIRRCNQAGISLLFNQASTGRVSGITYFINDFKIKGQSLGNRFKWAEIIKYIDYEQDRDSKAISTANHSTKTKYGELSGTENTGDERFTTGRGTSAALTNTGTNAEERDGKCQIFERNGGKAPDDKQADGRIGKDGSQSEPFEQKQNDSYLDTAIGSYSDTTLQSYTGIAIADDIDDEAIHGRNRRRQKKARTNSR